MKKESVTKSKAERASRASSARKKTTAAKKSAQSTGATKRGVEAKRRVGSGTALEGDPVVLLSGGNPQIAMGDGDAPVQAYIAALQGWKREAVSRLDALIVRNVPGVEKAVKWNSPFYGVQGQGWFLAIHTFTHYVKLSFFRGSSLQPVPSGISKDKDVRYVDLREGDSPDDAQMVSWVKQAAALPGWNATSTKSAAKKSKAVARTTDKDGASAAQQISRRIAELGDWRGEMLARIRKLIHEADSEIVEEWKWMGTPVWSHDGIVCTGETYKNVVKLTFAKGAALKDPAHLFNSSLDGNVRRAIDIHDGEVVHVAALKALIRAAVALNAAGREKAPKKRTGR